MITKPDPAQCGAIVMTSTIQGWIGENPSILEQVHNRLIQYLDGDWGLVDEDDWQANIDTIENPSPGGRLMGSYRLVDGRIIWIITDGYGRLEDGFECCYTTILSPDDY
ncbi:MAG: hypothetical protein ACO236_00340 [Candidatus Nanopelagicaceae bacterium]